MGRMVVGDHGGGTLLDPTEGLQRTHQTRPRHVSL